MAGILSGLGKFAEGLATGYGKAIKDRREQELHDATMQKVRDEQAMTNEIKKLSSTKAAASDAYTVVDAEGNKTVYADAAAAHDAAALNPGAEVQRKILVAGKQYDTPEDAQAAVEAANSPLAKTRLAAQIALKYNRPDVYDAHMKAYAIGVKANREDMAQSFYQAQSTGDLDQLAKVYNERLPNGVHVKFDQQPDGGIVMQTLKGDKPVGDPKPFKNAGELWAAGEQYMMKTPENALEVWKHSTNVDFQNRGLALETRKFDEAGKPLAAAQVAHADAQTKDIPLAAQDRRTNAAANATGASAQVAGVAVQADNALTQRAHLTAPVIKEGINPSGELSYGAITPTFDPKTGWGAPVMTAVGGTGLKMKPKPIDPVSAGLIPGNYPTLPGQGAGPQALSPQQQLELLRQALPPKTQPAAATPK